MILEEKILKSAKILNSGLWEAKISAGLKCRSQVTGHRSGRRSDHRPQVRSQVRSQVTNKNNRTLDKTVLD